MTSSAAPTLYTKTPKSPIRTLLDNVKEESTKHILKSSSSDILLSRSQRKLIAYLKAQFDEDIASI